MKTASPGNAEGITHQDQDEARESLRPSTSSAASESSGGARGANVMQDFRNSKRYKLVLIELEEAHMEKLRQPFAAPWGPEDDQLLVRFLCDSVNKSSGGQAKVLHVDALLYRPVSHRWGVAALARFCKAQTDYP